MTRPAQTAARARDDHIFSVCNKQPPLLPFQYERNLSFNSDKRQFGTLACHLLSLLTFRIKSLFLAPTLCLLTCYAVSNTSLDSVTIILIKLIPRPRCIKIKNFISYFPPQIMASPLPSISQQRYCYEINTL